MESMAPAPEPAVGQLFAGRYKIRAGVARGSMGRVYEAEQVPLGRSVALKLLDVTGARSAQDSSGARRYRERFLREASLLAKLSHPNTVRVYDYGVEGDRPFIVMEFVDGPTLRKLFGDQPFDALRCVRLAQQICRSLGEAHKLGLVHRDLKPENILVAASSEGEERIKVVDFGLVKEVEDAVHMTGDGLMLGTPMYMAPEQIRGRELDQRCDIYALGVLLFRALTGRHPFDEGQAASVLMAHLTDPVPTFSEVGGPRLPPCIEWTVRVCLEKAKEDRFASVDEALRALQVCELSLTQPEMRNVEMVLVDGRVTLEGDTAALAAPPRGSSQSTVTVVLVFLLIGALSLAVGYVTARGLATALPFGDAAPSSAEVVPAPPVAEPEPEPVPAGVGAADDDPEAPDEVEVDPEEEAVETAPEPVVAPAPPPRRVRPAPARPKPTPRGPPVEQSAAPEPAPEPAPAAAAAPPTEPATPEDETFEVNGSDLVDPWAQ